VAPVGPSRRGAPHLRPGMNPRALSAARCRRTAGPRPTLGAAVVPPIESNDGAGQRTRSLLGVEGTEDQRRRLGRVSWLRPVQPVRERPGVGHRRLPVRLEDGRTVHRVAHQAGPKRPRAARSTPGCRIARPPRPVPRRTPRGRTWSSSRHRNPDTRRNRRGSRRSRSRRSYVPASVGARRGSGSSARRRGRRSDGGPPPRRSPRSHPRSRSRTARLPLPRPPESVSTTPGHGHHSLRILLVAWSARIAERLFEEGDRLECGLLGGRARESRLTPVDLPVGILQAVRLEPLCLRHAINLFGHPISFSSPGPAPALRHRLRGDRAQAP
jgi:hypothetical protein